MLNPNVSLNYIDDPYPFFFGGPLLADADLERLNADMPSRDLYRREIKEGLEHKKRYNMWRFALFEQNERTPKAAALPIAWSELLDDALSNELRAWLTRETKVKLDGLPMTVGLYGFADGDYTTMDSGKIEKALSVALYLNKEWAADDGGNLHLWRNKGPFETPARTFVPRGGHVVVGWWGTNTWHSIAPVRTGRSRIAMMIEYWKN
jgi:hypothetical protein